MTRLVRETAESVRLTVLDPKSLEVIYIDKIDSPQDVRTFTEIGGRAPAHCTSSGKVGPSLSLGSADAVVAVAGSAAEADAAATAIANLIQAPDDVEKVVLEQERRARLRGLIACSGDRIGFWGDIELRKGPSTSPSTSSGQAQESGRAEGA